MDAVEEKGLKEIRTSLTVPLTSAIVRLEHIDKSVSDADKFRENSKCTWPSRSHTLRLHPRNNLGRMPIEWDGDGSVVDMARIERNLSALMRDLERTAHIRTMPTIAMARDWHRRTFEGVSVPIPYFRGGIRDSNRDEPELIDYPIWVRGLHATFEGAKAAEVPEQLRIFQADLRRHVTTLDILIPPGNGVLTQNADEVLELCSVAHGEWIRIHPFVNGNGRIARIWQIGAHCVTDFGHLFDYVLEQKGMDTSWPESSPCLVDTATCRLKWPEC